jgi:rSAM/selenodomain-associated transferase 2
MPAPFLSIILPVLNEAGGIRAHLAALQTMRDQGAELIVVDGGSADETPAQVRTLADKLIDSPRGRAVQMNAGARVASAEVLLFLHADTTLPLAADACVREAIAAGALWGRFDVRIDSARPALRIVELLMNWRSRLTGIATGDQAIFVRREAFERLGGFPELPLMEDIALSTLLKRLAPPACLRARVVTSGRHWERHGVARTIVLMWRLRAAFFFGADPGKLAVRYGYPPHQQ